MVIDQVNVLGWAMASMKVITVPTSTTNITGLRISMAGLSFLNDSNSACRRISPSNRLRDSATPCPSGVGPGWPGWVVVIVIRRTSRG